MTTQTNKYKSKRRPRNVSRFEGMTKVEIREKLKKDITPFDAKEESNGQA